MSDTIRQELLGRNILEMQAEQRATRMEMRLLRSQIAGTEGRLIDAINDRLSQFEVRIEDQLGRLQTHLEDRVGRVEDALGRMAGDRRTAP